MLHGAGSEANARDDLADPRCQHAPLLDRVAADDLPGLGAGVDRTGGAGAQAGGVIGMGMGQHDGVRRQLGDAAKPVRAAVDHDPSAAMVDHHCCAGDVAGFAPRCRCESRGR
jgi:hypothetical protein